MKVLSGSHALSDFRLAQLLKRLQEANPEIYGFSATYAYFVDLERGLSGSEETRLREILVESGKAPVELPDQPLLLVMPRPGTISPWSSKATDILHNCGLACVNRVERGMIIKLDVNDVLRPEMRAGIEAVLHDKMTEVVFDSIEAAEVCFERGDPKSLGEIDLQGDAKAALTQANVSLGLAISEDEIDYLVTNYQQMGRNPTDAELMMFAQANSEHCRHKIFNAEWEIDGQPKAQTLFGMIRNTHQKNPEGVLSAYKDNSSVMQGFEIQRFMPDPKTHEYIESKDTSHILMKVETHNHPTAISPFPGAATGSGGEIRDEGATGSGSRPKAGLCGFSVSNLNIPKYPRPWEMDYGRPDRIVSALDIMLEGPIGSAAFNNEFGRPGICGYFRTYEQAVSDDEQKPVVRGYHKPIMLAGGVGSIRGMHIEKNLVPPGTPIVVLGGPAMLIGLGGGAASSMTSGSSCQDLDFASVQRGNPEMQRRCQEVLNHCTSLGDESPILSIHDVGAGGLSNATPEIIDDAGRGGRFDLRAIPNAEPAMSPMEIWCNEAQERYVLAIDKAKLPQFETWCERERCPYAVLGYADAEQQLFIHDPHFDNNPVDMPLSMLLGKPPKMLRQVDHLEFKGKAFDLAEVRLEDAAERVLSLPTVASKQFLITIGDRTVTGLVARDQMVGPWQVPVADVAVTLSDFHGYTGEAMAIGEKAPLAILNAPASGRMAIAEAITNIAATRIDKMPDIKLSANWMAAAGHPGEDANLFDTVKAVGEALCPELGIAIPVGKDSLSMKTVWQQDSELREVVSPVSLIISAFAPVLDARKTLTPMLRTDAGDTDLIFIDLAAGQQRIGGSCLAQVYQQIGQQVPDVESSQMLKQFFSAIQSLNESGLLLAYHDRSDGGLFTTLCEMAFAGHTGIEVDLQKIDDNDLIACLFNEELGAVIQVRHDNLEQVKVQLEAHDLQPLSHVFGRLIDEDRISVRKGRQIIYSRLRTELQKTWSENSYQIQALRDNPDCAKSEFDQIDQEDPGMRPNLGFDPEDDVAAPAVLKRGKPKVAILREQGVNGHIEMAAAFNRAGFTAMDVHMSDIHAGQEDLSDCVGLVACGGFSYGDVLGAGGGWSKSILHHTETRDVFGAFFERDDVFGLGVCNGCQMMAQLKHLIPGAEHWPVFHRNLSEQFEARLSMVEVLPSPSILMAGMQGSQLPIAVAHGEGRAIFEDNTPDAIARAGLVSMRYIDHHGHATETYPDNPNGSSQGITGVTTADGRFTIMMPHPERVFRSVQYSWFPDEWGEDGPWLRLFRNARAWIN